MPAGQDITVTAGGGQGMVSLWTEHERVGEIFLIPKPKYKDFYARRINWNRAFLFYIVIILRPSSLFKDLIYHPEILGRMNFHILTHS